MFRKGLRKMKTLNYNCAAAWTLVGSFCGNLGKVKNPLMGAVPNQAKVLSQIIPLETTTKQHPLQGFFSSIAAASAALHRSLESAGCTVKTGWYMPLYSKPRSVGERLHNSVEPKRQNGQSWIISTRHAHLVWKQMEQVVKSIIFSCPFEESIV